MLRRDFFQAFTGSFAALSPLFFRSINNLKIPQANPKKKTERTEIKVKVLGTAQDGGLPQFACYCKNCIRARGDPHFSRLISSLALLDLKEQKFFLLDATPDIRRQVDIIHEMIGKEYKGSKYFPQGVILTHAHIGHYTGLMFFGFEAASSSDLPIYCSKGMGTFLANNGPWSQLVHLKNISLQTLTFDREIPLTSQLSFTPFLVPHRDEYSDTIGLTISGKKKKLLYIPDIQNWKAWKRSIVREVSKVDIALLDGTFYSPEELPGRDLSRIGHPFIESSIKLLEKIAREGKRKIYFTHLNHTNFALDPEGIERKQMEEQGFKLASDGMEFFL